MSLHNQQIGKQILPEETQLNFHIPKFREDEISLIVDEIYRHVSVIRRKFFCDVLS